MYALKHHSAEDKYFACGGDVPLKAGPKKFKSFVDAFNFRAKLDTVYRIVECAPWGPA